MNAPLQAGTGSATATDRNGNKITVDTSGHFFDTLSSTVAVLTAAGSGTPASPVTLTYTAPSGASAAYKVKYTNFVVRTNFGCTGVTESNSTRATTTNLVTEIDLPE